MKERLPTSCYFILPLSEISTPLVVLIIPQKITILKLVEKELFQRHRPKPYTIEQV